VFSHTYSSTVEKGSRNVFLLLILIIKFFLWYRLMWFLTQKYPTYKKHSLVAPALVLIGTDKYRLNINITILLYIQKVIINCNDLY